MAKSLDKAHYSRLVMDPLRSGSAFEVVFRGSDPDNEEPTPLHDLAPSASTDTSDLEAVSLSTGKLQKLSPSMSTENTNNLTDENVFHVEEDSPLRETRSDPFSKPRCWREASSLSIIIGSMVVFCFSITIAMIIQVLVGSPQIIPHAGVLSDDQECSEIGIRALSESAASTYPTLSSVDAAILTSLCLIVKNPHKGGLGGGGFMLVEKQHDATKDTLQFDFRESSPVDTDVSLNVPKDQVSSGRSVAVPGFIRGMEMAHDQFGIAAWKDLFLLTAELATKKVNVSEELATSIGKLDLSTLSPDFINLITKADNRTKLIKNDKLDQAQLAETLKIIGDNPNAFYTGPLAQSFVDAVSSNGGNITMSDMENYKATSSDNLLRVLYSNMSVVSVGPPSSGPVVLSTLNTLAPYLQMENSSDTKLLYHRMLEALKYSYGHQTDWLDVGQVENSFQTPFSIDDQKSFDMKHYLNSNESHPLQLNYGGDQHVTVIGYDGLVVNVVMGIGSPFGSRIMASGYLLNNAMLDFSWPGKYHDGHIDFPPSQANMIAPEKRPMSSLAPVLVLPHGTKCGLYLTFDAHEGTTAISAMTQAIINKASGLSMSDSIKNGRLNQEMEPYIVQAEASTPIDLTDYLQSLGHNVTRLNPDQTLGVSNVMSYQDGTVKSYPDQRAKDGNQTSVF